MHRVLALATAGVLALALAGCGKSEQAAQNAAQPAAAPATAATTANGQPLGDKGRAFIAEATGDDAFEIALGRMALEKSSTDQMHELAQRRVDDHTRMQRELPAITGRDVADGAASAIPNEKALQLRDPLAPLPGGAFRTAFVDVMLRNYHLPVALFSVEPKTGYSKALREYARKQLPALREHLAMAQAMLDAATPSTSQSGA
jgi:putative membrane protein